ncbi:MAG TPA: hypothetical protein VLA62_02855 [Solirubrobacterales bacterium]|nr:hypothetical protein [Solirubrobacterales bacterium]
MRTFGIVMLFLGVVAFFYCSGQMNAYPALPAGLSITEAWQYPQGRYQVGQYAAGFVAFVGLLFTVFPKGR